MKRVFIFLIVFTCSLSLAKAADYYWVAGADSKWSTVGNWRTASGGGTAHATVPTFADNVIFDANSFTSGSNTVEITGSDAICKSMTWAGVAGTPTFAGNMQLSIYGSLTLDPNMTVTYTGNILFEATTPGHLIKTCGKTLTSFTFNGAGGSWQLDDDLNLNNVLRHNNGSFSTNGHTVNAVDFYSNSGNVRTLNIANSTLQLGSSSAGNFEISSANLTFTGTNSTIRFIGTGPSPLFQASTGLTFHNVEFTTVTGNANLIATACTFNNVSFASTGSVSAAASNFFNLTFAGNGSLYGSSAYTTMVLATGKKYMVEAGSTQNINTLIANGNCSGGYIEIITDASGTAATFQKTAAGGFTVDRIILKDIHASGAGPFVANNSINNGNNTGWTINQPPPTTLYWVGGTGDWSDAAHWSATSGGAGGTACVPTPLDSVVFDANSFTTAVSKTVTINIDANCGSMTWAAPLHTPQLASISGVSLNIYKHLTLSAGMNISFTCDIYFRATTTGNRIVMAGKTFPATVYFDGVGGGWNLMDNFSTTGRLKFLNGNINTNNNAVNCWAFESGVNNVRTLTLGASTITISGPVGWSTVGTNFTLNAGTSLIRFTNSSELRNTAVGKTFYDVEFVDYGRLENSGGSFRNVSFLADGNLNENMSFNTLSFSAGNSYTLQNSRTQVVNSLVATGTCAAPISISSSSPTFRAIISSANNITGNYLRLKAIEAVGGGIFTANNSDDLGNNTGWTINTMAPRNLYWVNDGGNWNAPSHWSLSSGGAGGECPPTRNDNVFFDANSFTLPAQAVSMNVNGECKSMDWTGVTNTPAFNDGGGMLDIYGSLTFVSNMLVSFFAQTNFLATTTGNTITTAGKALETIVFNGVSGEWNFADNLTANGRIIHTNGNINTGGYNVTCRNFSSYGAARELIFGASVFTVADEVEIDGINLILNAGTSLIKMMGTGAGLPRLTFVSSATAPALYDVAFHNLSNVNNGIVGSGAPCNFHNVIFYGPGYINGNVNYNKLTFSPGKTYILQSGRTQTVDTLVARGNPCLPITIRASTAGSQSTIAANNIVYADYVDLRDQHATGPASFFAGQFSPDVGNNTGWVFNNAPGYIYGLGPDTTFQTCGNPIILTTLNFNATISTTYTWNTGNTTDTLEITTPGKYWVTANYGAGCLYTDTIDVMINPLLLDLQVSSATSICLGSTATLTASGGASYTWSPSTGLSNTTGSSVTANPNVTTSYTVTAVNGICTDSKTITVTVNNTIITTSTVTICSGQSAMIHGNNETLPGVYSHTTTSTGGCDSISDITLVVNNNIITTATVTICSGQSVMIHGNNETLPGVYSHTTTSTGGCDSISDITLVVNNNIITTATVTICSGQSVMIHGNNESTAGLYSQTYVAVGGCDSISNITLVVNNTITTAATIIINSSQSAIIHGNSETIAGVYSQIFVAANGCDSVSDITLVVNSTIVTTSTVTICSGQSAMIHGISQTTPGIYSYTYAASTGGDSISTITLLQNELPLVSFASDTTQGCGPLCINFTNTTPNTNTMTWDFGDANTSTDMSPQHCYTTDGTYSVKLIITDNNGCRDSLTTTNMITVHPAPISQFIVSTSETTILAPTVDFRNQSIGATEWTWHFGETHNNTSTDQNPTYTYGDAGSYTVKQIVVNQYGCADSSEQQITITAAYAFYVPNAITPNNDGLNDEFIPMSTGLDITRDYELTIYNRWGNLIFKTSDPFQSWNARNNNTGDIVPQDTYTWKITTRDMFGKSHAYNGCVTVIR